MPGMPQPRSQWLVYAITSGGCAALNGAFAKLVTTNLTKTWATGISHVLGLGDSSTVVELIVRGLFFFMNLAFNAIMWGLFTRALTLASSTVRVSVINTSANFMVTALLGALVFSEELPGLWWLGAGMLVAGSVIIGRREEGSNAGAAGRESVIAAQDDLKRDAKSTRARVEGTSSDSDLGHGDSMRVKHKPIK